MKKFSLLLPLIVLIPFVNGCQNNETPTSSGVLLNSFESIQDLYNFRVANADSKNELKFDVNTNKTYIKDGNGSLKIDIYHGEVTNLIFPFKKDNKNLFEFNKLSSIEADIYNDSNNMINISNILYTNGLITLLKSDQSLPNKSWSHIKFSVSALAIENNYENLSGYELKILSPLATTLYLDNVKVNVNLAYSEEDKEYKNIINEIQDDISALPGEISINDYNKLKDIYDKYASLPTLYKRIVKNYNVLVNKLEDLSIIIDSDKPLADGQTVFDYDKFYGVGQISNHPSVGGDCEFFYQKETRFDTEEGALRVDFNGKQENYLGYTYPQHLSEYETLVYHIYIDDQEHPDNRIVYFGWEHPVTVEANVWTTVTVNPNWLLTATWGIIVVQVRNGTSISSTGSMYLGSVYGKLSSFNYIDSALNYLNPVSTFGVDNKVEITEDKNVIITAKEDGELNIRLNKNYLILKGNEAAILNFNASFAGKLLLIGFNGEVEDTINLIKGWNTIELSNTMYEKVYTMVLDVKNGDVVMLYDFIVYRADQHNLASLIIKSRYSLDISKLSIDNVPEYLNIINDFDSLDEIQLSILKVYNKDIVNSLNSLKNKMCEGSPNLLSQYTRQYLDNYDDTTIPMVIISLYKMPFFINNISATLIEELNSLVNLYKVSYGDIDSPHLGIDYPWEGSIVPTFDSEKGSIYNINISKMNFDNYLDIENTAFELDGVSAVAFEIYNPLKYDVNMIYYNVNSAGVWEAVTSTTLKHLQWNHIELNAASVTGARNFICLCHSNLCNSGWKLTYYYGIKYEKYASDAIKAIESLPTEVTTEIDKMQVLSAESLYNSLDDNVKPYVYNYSKLQALLPVSGLKTVIEINSGWSDIFSTRVMTDYGVAGKGSPATNGTNLMKALENNSLHELARYDHTVFYIYVPTGYTNTEFFFQYDATWKGLSFSLVQGQWNRIQINSDEWFDHQAVKTGKTYCYIKSEFEGSAPNENWFLTSFYGYND